VITHVKCLTGEKRSNNYFFCGMEETIYLQYDKEKTKVHTVYQEDGNWW
jgi:hypothetical protein